MPQIRDLIQEGFDFSMYLSIDRAINQKASIPNNRTIKKDLHQKHLIFKTK